MERFWKRMLAKRPGIVVLFGEDGLVEMYHSVQDTRAVAVFARVFEAVRNPIGTFIWHNN